MSFFDRTLAKPLRGRRPAARRFTPLAGESLEERTVLTQVLELWDDINTSPLGLSVNSTPVEMGGVAYFSGSGGDRGEELWRTDGTADGTWLVKDIKPGRAGLNGSSHVSSSPAFVTAMGDRLYFRANDGTHGYELWRSDGTAEGTMLVKDLDEGADSSNPHSFVGFQGSLFFVSGSGLYKTDGTAPGTVLLKSFASPKVPPIPFLQPKPDSFFAVGGTLYFRGHDDAHGFELWKTDGTIAGTVLVKDVLPGVESSRPYTVAALGGKLYFKANDGTHGWELWKSDGTDVGTTLVADLKAGGADANPVDFKVWQEKLVLWTSDATSESMWQSDGTTSGTALLRSFAPRSEFLFTRFAGEVNGSLLFRAAESGSGDELWKTDGTTSGTVLVKDIQAGPASSGPREFAVAGGGLFFAANDGVSGYELWKSDGTTAGTQLVKDIRAGAAISDPRYLFGVGGTLYFRAYDGIHGLELWKSDGTASGTVLIKDLHPTGDALAFNADPRFFNLNGTLLFNARDLLYKTDAAEGAVIVPRGTASSFPGWLTNLNGKLIYTASDDDVGTELWSATAAGESEVISFAPGVPFLLTNVAGTLFFVQTRSAPSGSGQDRFLYRSDGTAAGTRQLKYLGRSQDSFATVETAAVNGSLFFRGQ